MKRILIAAALLVPAAAAAREPKLPTGLHIDRVVVIMRHGVRPPTKTVAMPAGVADLAWPNWSVAPGDLTEHGAAAITLVGAYDRGAWTGLGVLPRTGCAAVRIVADSDQRTIATAEAWAAAVQPGCSTPLEHTPQGAADPRFSPVDEGAAVLDASAANAAMLAAAGPDGIAAVAAREAPLLRRLDTILCHVPAPTCGVLRKPSGFAPARPDRRPKLTGALDRASTAAQILLLEYGEGKPLAEVGWGRATAVDVAALSRFHALEFALLARPAPLSRANLALLAPLIATSLTAPDGATVTMISGHDTTVASLGGLLGVHWRVPGLAADDPSPGGAIVLERLVDAAGHRYARALYRSQTLDQIRLLTPLTEQQPYLDVLRIAGCTARGVPGLCTEADLAARLRG